MATHVTREADLFVILVELLADKKLERNALRVLVGTRGFELGRPYMHLCQQGLIEEEVVRPGFWRRLFGARETLWVRLTEHGRKVAATTLEEKTPTPSAEQSPAAAPLAEVPVEIPAPVKASGQAESAESALVSTVVPEAVSEAAPTITPPPALLETTIDLPATPPQAEPAPIPKPAPREKAAPPRRFAPTDFTETLGGAPLDRDFQTPSSDRLDDLTENLGLLGFEITEAGKLLAVNRWSQDISDAEVALEVITTALAHAARLSAAGTAELDPGIAQALAGRVQENFDIFVAEGLLDAETLTLWADRMTRFLKEPVSTSGLEEYLLDPWRGIAPPAVCPDEIYLQHEIEAD